MPCSWSPSQRSFPVEMPRALAQLRAKQAIGVLLGRGCMDRQSWHRCRLGLLPCQVPSYPTAQKAAKHVTSLSDDCGSIRLLLKRLSEVAKRCLRGRAAIQRRRRHLRKVNAATQFFKMESFESSGEEKKAASFVDGWCVPLCRVALLSLQACPSQCSTAESSLFPRSQALQAWELLLFPSLSVRFHQHCVAVVIHWSVAAGTVKHILTVASMTVELTSMMMMTMTRRTAGRPFNNDEEKEEEEENEEDDDAFVDVENDTCNGKSYPLTMRRRRTMKKVRKIMGKKKTIPLTIWRCL